MGVLTREAILAADSLPKELVQVPEWGGDVYVRAMTGAERDSFEASFVGADGKVRKLDNIRAKLCALSICDEGGSRLFSDADIIALGKTSASALQRVFKVAQKLSGLGDDAVEELAKN